MEERHEREQYFFDDRTLERLDELTRPFETVACLCAPTLGERLARAGREVTILDIDKRFAHVPGFELFDLERPRWIERSHALIVCDPPFFNVSLSRLKRSIEALSHHDTRQPIALAYLSRRRDALLRAFATFALRPTGFRLRYRTVEDVDRNDIELFSNLPDAALAPLRGTSSGSSAPTE